MANKYCPSCGSVVEEGDNFCEECGADIDSIVEGKGTSQEPDQNDGSDTGATAKNAVGYLSGAFFALFALVALSEFALLSVSLFVIAALFSIPDSRRMLLENTDADISQYAIVTIVVVGMIAGMATLPTEVSEEGAGTPIEDQGGGTTDSTTGQSEDATTNEDTSEDTSQNDASTTQNEPSGPVIEGEPRDVHQLGDSFQVGDIEYTALDVRTTSAIGSGFTRTEADGIYVIVDMRMTNVGDEPTSISRSPISLIDGQDRTHDTSSDGMFTYEDTIGIFGEEANPGITHEGAVIFDVPTGQQERYLKVSQDPLFGEEEVAYVDLSS